MDELSQPVVSDGEMAGDNLSEAPSCTAAAPASKSPALTKQKQHPTYKGSSALASRSLFPSAAGHRMMPPVKCPHPRTGKTSHSSDSPWRFLFFIS